MHCSWGWPGGFHFGGGLFWIVLLFVGLAVFLVLRRRKTEPAGASCGVCNGTVGPAYLRCPHCGTTLKSHCPDCSGIVDSRWQYCPHCRAELKQRTENTE